MSTDKKSTGYVSKYGQLRIVLKPTYTTEQQGRIITHAGNSVQFENGYYETDNEVIVEALEARPEFGSVFIRVPDDTEAAALREERFANQDEREKELDRREADLAKREALLKSQEAGRTETTPYDHLETLKRPALNKIAEDLNLDEDLYKVGKSNKDVIEAIREAQDEKGPNPLMDESREEGGGTPAY